MVTTLKNLVFFIFVIGLALCLTEALGAEEPHDPTATWLKHVRRCVRKVFSLRADFVQEIKYKRDHPEGDVLRGVVEVRRGGRYRLTYKLPEKRLVVCDGQNIWSFDKPTKTAYSASVEGTVLDEALGLLTGDENEVAFLARYLGGASCPDQGKAAIELLPRNKDALVASIIVTLNNQCPCIQRILVVDHAGSVMRLTLNNIETNVGLGKRRFLFKPPKGTKIITP